MVYVEGKITYRKYTDQNGIERKITEIVANTLRGLEKREGSANGTGSNAYFPSEPPAVASTRTQHAPETTYQPPQQPAPAQSSPAHTASVAQAEDDLPF
jgi:single-strand DNA-binding protein